MKLKYFGDSYDIVKKSLIGWLKGYGPSVTHPMFTEEVNGEQAASFLRLIGTPLLSMEVLTKQTSREEYFSSCSTAGNLFLDPDTGVSPAHRGGQKSINYIFGSELISWCVGRPKALTLTFDQSYSRGGRKEAMQRKLGFFAQSGITGVIYDSHATFLLLSADVRLMKQARQSLLENSGLPEHRLVVLK